jgi:hypothetical protein
MPTTDGYSSDPKLRSGEWRFFFDRMLWAHPVSSEMSHKERLPEEPEPGDSGESEGRTLAGLHRGRCFYFAFDERRVCLAAQPNIRFKKSRSSRLSSEKSAQQCCQKAAAQRLQWVIHREHQVVLRVCSLLAVHSHVSPEGHICLVSIKPAAQFRRYAHLPLNAVLACV